MKRKRNIPSIQFFDVNEGTQINYYAPNQATMFYGIIRPTYSNKDIFKIFNSGWAPEWLKALFGDFSSVEEAEESILSAFAAHQKSENRN